MPNRLVVTEGPDRGHTWELPEQQPFADSSLPAGALARQRALAGTWLVLGIWSCLMLFMAATAPLKARGSHLIAHTIRIALFFYFVSLVLILSPRVARRLGMNAERTARMSWTMGWVTFVLHVLAAFA